MIKQLFASLLIVIFIVSLVPISADAQLSEERVIVLFKDKVDKNVIGQLKGKVNAEFKNVPALAVTAPSASIAAIKKNPNVKSVEKDIILKVNAQTADWGITRTQAKEAWDSGLTGKGVKIAVVDTGIANHEDLNIAGGVSTVDYTNSFNDDNGHGTHVAGIVGAENNSIGVVGIAPDADIYAVKSLDANGSGYLSDIIEGIDWAVMNNMDIINLSLGTTSHSTTLQQIVDKAYSQNILVVAAAGNNGSTDGSGDTVNYPARYNSVIAVAATDSSDKRASFSATGSTVEVAAPGVGVLSTYINNQYARSSGTSMATPYVAGNLALLKQANSTLSAKDLRIKLQQGVVDLGTAGKDAWFGYGLIQAPKMQPIAQESAQTTPVQYNSKTTLVSSKSIYKIGETVSLTMTSYDQNGKTLAGATAEIVVYNPLGIGKVYNGTTNADGQFKGSYSTSKLTNLKGKYQVKATTTKEGFIKSESVQTFELR